MVKVISTEIDTTPADRAKRAFGNILGEMKSDAKEFEKSVDGMKKSIDDFNKTVNTAKFSKPIADEAQIVAKAGATVGRSVTSIGARIKSFAATLGAGIWTAVRGGITGIAAAFGSLASGAVSSIGSIVSKIGSGGGGGAATLVGALFSFKALLLGVVTGALGIMGKIQHYFVETADAADRLRMRLDSMGFAFEDANRIAEITGASVKTVAGEYDTLAASLAGTGASSEQIRVILQSATAQLHITGNDAEETRAKIMGLANSFQNGSLSINEWRRLASDFPAAAESMRQSIGATDDQMAKLARDGDLHASDFGNAMIRTAGVVNQKSLFMAESLEQSEGRMATSWKNLIATISDDTGLSWGFKKFEDIVIKGLDGLAARIKARGGVLGGWSDSEIGVAIPPLPDNGEQNYLTDNSPLKLLDLTGMGKLPPANLQRNDHNLRDVGLGNSLKERIQALKDENNLILVGLNGNQKAIDAAQVELNVERATTAEMRLRHPQQVQQLRDQENILVALRQQQAAAQELNGLGQQVGTTLSDAFMDIAKGTRSFKDGIRQATASIIEMIAQTLILKPLIEDIGRQFQSLGGSSGLTGLLSSFSSGGLGSLFGGGDVGLGSWAPTIAFASGGPVNGPGTGTSDSIPAMLSNGEYVVNADASRKYGALLDAINTGNIRAFASGGPVPSMPMSVGYTPATVSVPGGSSSSGAGPTIVFSPTYHIAGDLTEETRRRLNDETSKIVSNALAKAAPQIVKQSKIAVQREHKESSRYLRR